MTSSSRTEPPKLALEAPALIALVTALGLRVYFSGRAITRISIAAEEGGARLDFLVIDFTWIPLLAVAGLWAYARVQGRWAQMSAATIALAGGFHWSLCALTRYWNGQAQAWDLANYVQPMWRSAHGLDMSSAVFEGREVWADHGAYVMFLLAPLTRLFDDAATGLLLTQCLFASLAVVLLYALARALTLPPWLALCVSLVFASSRALAQALRFDFHPESLLPVGLFAIAWAHERQRLRWALVATLLCVSLRDMAALTASALWFYFALRSPRRPWPWALAIASSAVALFDMFVLPNWSGWYSYVALNTSAPLAPWISLKATVLRALSTFGLGWLHPLAWIAGAPWLAAAFVSSKLGVKGIDYQYGFFFVPVAALGAAYALRWLQQTRPRWLVPASLLWLGLAIAVNAPPRASLESALGARGAFNELRVQLARWTGASKVAADACAAPYVMERPDLTLLCRLDVPTLKRTGHESWQEAVPAALSMDRIVVRRDCAANGPCVASQLNRAVRGEGYVRVGQAGPFLVLSRTRGSSPISGASPASGPTVGGAQRAE